MRFKRSIAAALIAVAGVVAIPSPASAGCASGTIATLYKKITGDELYHCD